MVSDLIDEVIGYLRDESDEARVLLETSRDGYFTNDNLLQQVEKAVDIYERSILMLEGYLFLIMPLHTVKWPMML